METQDKALRRISELREQCSLEQQAKAHLESALRIEMDEQQCIIKTMKTKLSLLGENPEDLVKNGNNNLINLTEANGVQQTDNNSQTENLINMLDVSDASASSDKENSIVAGASIMINDSNEKIKLLEKQIAEEKGKSAELSRLLDASQQQVKVMIKREEDNTILLAQNKLAIHSELENREKEMKTMKIDAKQSASEKECLNEILTELRDLNSKANEKCKELTEAKRLLEERVDDMKKKAATAEDAIKELQAKVIVLDSEKQSIVGKTSLELEKFKARYDSLQRKNEQLEDITRTRVIESHEKLESELKQLKESHEEMRQQLAAEKANTLEYDTRCQEMLIEHRDSTKRMSIDLDSLRADKMKLESRFKQLFEDKSNALAELEATKSLLAQANGTIHEQRTRTEQLQQDCDVANETISGLEKASGADKTDSTAESNGLRTKIEALKTEKRDLEKTLEKEIREKSELQIQVTNILQEIGRLEEQLKEVKGSYAELERINKGLEESIGSTNDEIAQQLTTKLKEYEAKLKGIECENSQFAEKNCLLEETNNRLQVSHKELEANVKKHSADNQEASDRMAALTLELESLKEENGRLQDKLKTSLDNYAELFNAKEQMDQEHRSLLDQIETKEKEKLCVIDQQQNLEREKLSLTEKCEQLQSAVDAAKSESVTLTQSNIDLQSRMDKLNDTITEMTAMAKKESSMHLDEIQSKLEICEQTKIENEYLNKSIKHLEDDATAKTTENAALHQELTDMKEKFMTQQCELYVLQDEKNERTKVFDDKTKEIEQLKTICQRSQEFTGELQKEQSQLNEQLATLKLLNDELQTTKYSIETKLEKLSGEFDVQQQALQQQQSQCAAIESDSISVRAELTANEESLREANEKLDASQKELDSCRAIINDLNTDLNSQTEQLETKTSELSGLQERFDAAEANFKASEASINTVDELKKTIDHLQCDVAETKLAKQNEIAKLNHEIEDLMENIRDYREKHLEYEQIKSNNESLSRQIIQLQNEHERQIQVLEANNVSESRTGVVSSPAPSTSDENSEATDSENVVQLRREKGELEERIIKIVAEVQDVSNRNLFLEQQCENFLILEQQNERLKLQNSKLSQQLDETLVCVNFIWFRSERFIGDEQFDYNLFRFFFLFHSSGVYASFR